MEKIIGSITIIGLLLMSACSSAPKPGETSYIREQVYQCRMLCAGGDVSITKIEGLDCVCNKPERSQIVISPIITNNVVPTQPGINTVYTQKETFRVPVEAVTPNETGVSIIDSSGRRIVSQTKDH